MGSDLPPSVLEKVAAHERVAVLVLLALAAGLGLIATLWTGDALMMAMPPFDGPVANIALLFVMWWTMMMAMMLPSAAPVILLYGSMRRSYLSQGHPQPPLISFVLGYAAVWTGFSAAAVGLQIVVQEFVPLTGMMAVTSTVIGGGLLLSAGIYQLTPFKQACLRNCQAPLMFLARHWRNDAGGVFRMGVAHGMQCLGCCWVLMGLLFYGGVMELHWIVGLALYVAVEKLAPPKSRIAALSGIALIAWGSIELWSALLQQPVFN
jgi:predicted metal-binding membrane protein